MVGIVQYGNVINVDTENIKRVCTMKRKNKQCTNIKESIALSSILPKESADMQWIDDGDGEDNFRLGVLLNPEYFDKEHDILAWSLSALLDLIKIDYRIEKTALDQSGEFTYSIIFENWITGGKIRTYEEEDLIDAAVQAIKVYKILELSDDIEKNQVSIPGDFYKLVEDNFWELVGNGTREGTTD